MLIIKESEARVATPTRSDDQALAQPASEDLLHAQTTSMRLGVTFVLLGTAFVLHSVDVMSASLRSLESKDSRDM